MNWNEFKTTQPTPLIRGFEVPTGKTQLKRRDKMMNNETLRERLKQGDFKDINNWDVSKVTNMNGLFFDECFNEFNEDISNWDVSNVTDMRRMFSGCFRFNQDIGGWNVSKVTDMQEMFAYIESFNQDIGGWDVSNVTNMSQMFTYDSALFKCYDTWQAWRSRL